MEGERFYGSNQNVSSERPPDELSNFEDVYIKASFDELPKEQIDPALDNPVKTINIESEESFKRIYREYNYSLFTFSLSILRNREDAEDVTADVFFKLWQQRTKYTEIENIKGFLYTSVRNESITLLRKKDRTAARENKYADRLETITAPDELTGIRAQYKKRILDELHNLTKSQKAIFVLACFHGLKNPEIARKLRISLSTVKSHKATAVQKLRQAAQQKVPLYLISILKISHFFAHF